MVHQGSTRPEFPSNPGNFGETDARSHQEARSEWSDVCPCSCLQRGYDIRSLARVQSDHHALPMEDSVSSFSWNLSTTLTMLL